MFAADQRYLSQTQFHLTLTKELTEKAGQASFRRLNDIIRFNTFCGHYKWRTESAEWPHQKTL